MSFIMSWGFYALSVNCASIFCNSLPRSSHICTCVSVKSIPLSLPCWNQGGSSFTTIYGKESSTPNPASMTNTILGHDDHSWINGCDGDDFDDIDIVIIVRSYTKKWNLDNFAQGSYLCEAYLNPCTSVSTWIATNQFGSKLGHDICKLERHMQPLLAS